MLSLYAGTKGLVDDVPVRAVQQWETDFLQFAQDKHPDLIKLLDETSDISDEVVEKIEACISAFKSGYKNVEQTQ